MSIRSTLLSIALGAAFAVPAFAIDGAAFVDRQGAATYGGPLAQQHSTATRADLRREVQAARHNGTLMRVDGSPVYDGQQTRAAARQLDRAPTAAMGAAAASNISSDGYRDVGGEIGRVFVGAPGAR